MCKLIEKGLVGLAPRRKRAGYTQETFAEALGVTRSLLAAWEVGRAWPSAGRLPAMADLLGCSIDDLYELPETEAATDCLANAAALARNDSVQRAETCCHEG